MSMLASQILALPCFVPLVGLSLCGYIHPPHGLLGCNHLWDASQWCRFARRIPFLRPIWCCLPCLLCATSLASYAFFLHACLHVNAWLFACLCCPYSNLMELWTLVRTPFTFPAPFLSRIPWVWQYLFYISYTLIGYTLGTLAMFDLLFYSMWLHCACCMYIYIYLCMGDCALCMMDSGDYMSDLL